MKTMVRAALTALVILGWSGTAPAQGLKIAFVDSHVLLRSAPGTTEAQQMLQRETAAFDAEVAKMSDSLKKMQKAYQDAEATLSPQSRTARQTELQTTLEKFSRNSDSLRELAGNRQRDVLQPVYDLINKVLQDVRAEDGISVIFDLGADGQNVVAYDKNLDITDKVLERVKKQPAPKLPPTILKSPAKPPPPAPKPE